MACKTSPCGPGRVPRMRCSWSTYSASARKRFTSQSSARTSTLPGFRSWIATRSARVSGGLNRMRGLLFIHTVHQRVNAPCLILAELADERHALPYSAYGTTNRPPYCHLCRLGLQCSHHVWARSRHARTPAQNAVARGAARVDRRWAATRWTGPSCDRLTATGVN
jgi:hypothetical protein